MMRWALARRLIHENPTIYVRVIGGSRDRGLLSLEEARALLDPGTIDTVWNRDLLHYTLSLVAASTGLRQGELLAIRVGDVHKGWIDVSHGYGRMSGEKETKTRRARISSIPSRATDYLRKISREDPAAYVFSRDGVSPISYRTVSYNFNRALARIGISNEEREERFITFHSWRTFLNTILRSRGVPDALVRDQTGHATVKMTEKYTSFIDEHYRPIREITEEL